MSAIPPTAATIAVQLQAAAARKPAPPAPGLQQASAPAPAAAEPDRYAEAKGRREAPLAGPRETQLRPGSLVDLKV